MDYVGKVERSHGTGDMGFYRLISYTDDEDHNQEFEEWEHSHNFNRPHKSMNGKTPYEVLKEKLPCAI